MAETPNTFPSLTALGLGAGFAGPLGALMGMGSLFEGISGMFAAKDEAKRKEELFQATKEALLDAHEQEGAQERVGTMQERAQVAEEMKNVSIQGITARGQAGAGAGGAGIWSAGPAASANSGAGGGGCGVYEDIGNAGGSGACVVRWIVV